MTEKEQRTKDFMQRMLGVFVSDWFSRNVAVGRTYRFYKDITQRPSVGCQYMDSTVTHNGLTTITEVPSTLFESDKHE